MNDAGLFYVTILNCVINSKATFCHTSAFNTFSNKQYLRLVALTFNLFDFPYLMHLYLPACCQDIY